MDRDGEGVLLSNAGDAGEGGGALQNQTRFLALTEVERGVKPSEMERENTRSRSDAFAIRVEKRTPISGPDAASQVRFL